MSAIEIKGVTKFYGQQKALDAVDLQIKSGEVLGLLGPNGAGKSTLMKILCGFIPPSSGSVHVHGMNIRTDALKIRRLVGYLPENNPLYPEMYVREYLNFVLRMYGNHPDTKKRVTQMIELTGLGPEQHKKIGDLSKGYRQRVGLAQALIHDPEVLILDEPTSGLDPNQLKGIRALIASLGKEKTVILSTHIMQEVEALCGRVAIINKGKLVADEATVALSKLKRSANRYQLELKETIKSETLLKLPFVVSAESEDGKSWLIEAVASADIREDLFQFAVNQKYNVLSLSREGQKMEDIFRFLTTDKDQI